MNIVEVSDTVTRRLLAARPHNMQTNQASCDLVQLLVTREGVHADKFFLLDDSVNRQRVHIHRYQHRVASVTLENIDGTYVMKVEELVS